jgi:hypothetical protein
LPKCVIFFCYKMWQKIKLNHNDIR